MHLRETYRARLGEGRHTGQHDTVHSICRKPQAQTRDEHLIGAPLGTTIGSHVP